MIKKSVGLIAIAILFSMVSVLLHTPISSSAVTGSDWRAGRIIDDDIFTDKNSMTVDQIQAFLNTYVGTGTNGVPGQCDTNGTRISELGGGTRAQYGAAHGNPAPFTCLKDYYEVPKTSPGSGLPASNYGGVPIPTGARSAAQLIWDAAQANNISPKVLLVTLQKESAGPLTIDDWPFKSQYSYAMGAHCPDSTGCDPNYAGFSIQVSQAAALLRYYLDNMYQPWWPYKKPGINSILYNPNTSCGSSNVNIETMATAALYTYTPYQPDQAALNNLYGTGDACSAYGNRNFWRIYNDLFGSPNGISPTSYQVRATGPISVSPSDPAAGEPVTVNLTVQNFGTSAITFQTSILQCRFNTYSNCDSPYDGTITLQPGDQHTFTYTVSSPNPGVTYTLIPYFEQNGVWYKYGSQTGDPTTIQLNIPSMVLTSPITLSPSNPVAGEPVTAAFTAKNMGSTTVNYQTSVMQCRLNVSTNCDSNYGGAISLKPGDQWTMTYYLSSFQAGNQYSLIPYYSQDGIWHRYGATNYSNTLQYKAPMQQLIGSIAISPAQPVPGQDVTLTYTIQNQDSQAVTYQDSVLQCRFNTDTVCDPSYGGPLTLQPGDQHTFSTTITAVQAGSYTLTPYINLNGTWYRAGTSTAGGNRLQVDVPKYVADMSLVGDITTNPTQPIPGQTFTASYTVSNNGDKPAIYQTSILQCRLNTSTVCDPAYDGPVTIQPGTQHTFTINFPAVKAGTYRLVPYYMQNNTWYTYKPNVSGATSMQLIVPAYVANMQLVSPISVNPNQPSSGQQITVSYTVQNQGTQPAIYQTSILQCRFNTNTVCDPSYDGPLTIQPGGQHTFNISFPNLKTGQYTFTPYYMQNDTWYRYAPQNPGGQTSLLLTVP